MATQAQHYFSLQDYLELEFSSERRHYFFGGLVNPMPYTSDEHGRIVSNLIREIGVLAKETEYLIYPSDRMLYVPECQLNYYPDVMLVKGEPQFYQHSAKILATTNPFAIIEVLSDSTEDIDRIDKWACYRQISSLQQYLLIAQHKIYIDIYNRIELSDRWENTYVDRPEQYLQIAGFDISVADIYHRLEF